jgi:flagellar protein FliS
MTSNQQFRARFTEDALATASGPRVVVMAYDRLDRDLAGAIDALDRGDLPAVHELLCHAQDLVDELHGMLDVDRWEHAPALASVYRYVGELLVQANVAKRVAAVQEARRLLGELGDAFRTAAVSVATSADVSDDPNRRLSFRA